MIFKSNEAKSIVAMSVYYNDNLEWLKLSVGSVLEQTYQNYTFVIVIDGLLKKQVEHFIYSLRKKHPNIVIMSNQRNKGLSYSMNKVINWAKNRDVKYFFRMDADDICHPQRFEKQVKFMEDNCDIGVLGTSLIEINEDGIIVGKRLLPENHNILLKSFSRRCPLNHPTVAIRFNIFNEYIKYDSSLLNTQDYFLWIKMASQGVVFANLREPLLKFRRVKGFYKRRGRSKSLNEFRARIFAMNTLRQWSIFNFSYACSVFILRMMPAPIIRLAYKVERLLVNRKS